MGSGVSYGMRYLLRMIFNLAIDYDDDGNGRWSCEGKAAHRRPHPTCSRGIAERAITQRYEQAVYDR
jgi:hypothetical protein